MQITEYIHPLKSEDHIHSYLDRAEVFLKYREEFPSARPAWANNPGLAARLFRKRD